MSMHCANLSFFVIGLCRLLSVIGIFLLSFQLASAQTIPTRRTGQQLPGTDSTAANSEPLRDLPDTIRISRIDPRFPVSRRLLPDSGLSLAYVRFDPVHAYSPDYIGLNTIAQPAALNPVLGTQYQRELQMVQDRHPAYSDQPAPFFEQNVPFTYTAYDQGGEINDGQFRALLGRSFAKGWRIGANYHRIYQGGERNRYPRSRAQMISFGVTLSQVRDSSHHRTYAYLDLNNRSWDNSGGYGFARATQDSLLEEPFEAEPRFLNMRSEGRNSTYHVLHRYFLKEQLDSIPNGWAGSLSATYKQGFFRTTTEGADLASLGNFNIDPRGVRFRVSDRSVQAEGLIGYFNDPRRASLVNFSFQAGVYAGEQRQDAVYLSSPDNSALVGLVGMINGNIKEDFKLEAEADLPIGTRVGEGMVNGSLSWNYRERFSITAGALLERSRAPFSAQVFGLNDELINQPGLGVSTHSRLTGSATYQPLSITVTAAFDVYSNATVYDDQGLARAASGEIAIPSLSFQVPIRVGPVTLDNRGVLRNSLQTSNVLLPLYTGQHALYYQTPIFKRALDLIVGLDARVMTATGRYTFAPLVGAFGVADNTPSADLQYAADAFIAIKVQSFKAFLRMDNLLVSKNDPPPSSVYGYPIVRGQTPLGVAAYLRLGVAFFLFN